MGNKTYYWLRLKVDFFRQREIKKLRKIAGGDTYTIIYLKMQLLSLKNEGLLFYEGTEESFEEQLSLEIDEELDNVKITLAYLFRNNLIEEVKDNEFLLPKAKECMGKESGSAERVRKHRKKQAIQPVQGQTTLQCNTDVTDSNKNVTTEIELEIELDKDIEIELDKDIETEKDKSMSSVVHSNIEVFKHFEKCGFIMSTKLMEFIAADIEIYGPQWLMDAADTCVKRGKLNNYGYLKGILQNWQTEGRKEKSKDSKFEPNPKTAGFNNFEPREYDYDDLEKKLLGWDKDDGEE
ncbi:phage replisome organizer N-terminal domain-containing protein [Clostridium neonatale]|uniref:phage replisome organizer N-terminal domain-containing protein n=1 Tax=Clostridium neonatale TaxID=137838 RepID=UPI00291B8421|nr:putative Phage replisome organizer, N-terminal region [Clostridium neonatale]